MGGVVSGNFIQEVDEYAVWVGRLIGTWNILEWWLFKVFRELLGAADERAAGAIFHRVSGLNPKLELIETLIAVLDANRQASIKIAWKPLAMRIRAEAKMRNLVVHGATLHTPTGIVAGPPMGDPRYAWPFQREQIKYESMATLEASCRAVHQLSDATRRFATQLGLLSGNTDPDAPYLALKGDIETIVASGGGSRR